MRSLKFRAWSNENNRYCDFVTLDEDGRWIGWIKSSGVYLTTIDINLEQYTGLKDKNDKEVYEGDLVEVEDVGRFEVKWYNEIASFLFKPNMQMKYHPPFNSSQMSVCEVIGNVHKNPELLKEKEYGD